MSFDTILRKILEDCGGGLAVALMGNDGVPVEQLHAPGAESALGGEVGAAGAEFGRILDEIRKTSDVLGGGTLHEAMISLSRFVVVLRSVDEDLFLALALSPEGNLGKARYLLRREIQAIRAEL